MKFTSCIFYKSYLYFIFAWILDLFNSFEYYCFKDTINDYEKYIIEVRLIYLLCLSLAELSAGFLVIITKIKMNYLKKVEIRKNSKKEIKLIYNDLSIKKNKYTFIILVSILDFIARCNSIIMFLLFDPSNLEDRHIKWIISIDISSRILFSRLMLKIKLYKHHVVSILLCSIGFFIMIVFALQSIIFGGDGKYFNLNNWIFIISIILQKNFYAIEDSISKILLTDKFLLPHYLMFLRGCFSFILYLILCVILFLTSYAKISNFKNLFEGTDFRVHLLLKGLRLISSFVRIFSIFKIIDIFTPIHVGFLNIVSSFTETIQFTIVTTEKEHIIHIVFDMICLFVIGFGTLIFTEILIVNACGMNEKTKPGLLLNEQLDKFPPECTIFSNDVTEDHDETRSKFLNEDTIVRNDNININNSEVS